MVTLKYFKKLPNMNSFHIPFTHKSYKFCDCFTHDPSQQI